MSNLCNMPDMHKYASTRKTFTYGNGVDYVHDVKYV